MMICHIAPRVILDFWIEKTEQEATIYCKKNSDVRDINECEKYPVISITKGGELKRHSGLPSGWGFTLTASRKVQEIR